MGVINWLLGGGAKQVGGIVEQVGGVFRPNAERSAQRSHDYDSAALGQYAAEFQRRADRTWFDSLADGINRLVRPVIALSVFGVLPATAIWPEHMAVVFAAWVLLPVSYWGMMSGVMGFYFAGRMQFKAHEIRKDIEAAAARAPQVIETMQRLRSHMTPDAATDDSPEIALEIATETPMENRAVADWRKTRPT